MSHLLLLFFIPAPPVRWGKHKGATGEGCRGSAWQDLWGICLCSLLMDGPTALLPRAHGLSPGRSDKNPSARKRLVWLCRAFPNTGLPRQGGWVTMGERGDRVSGASASLPAACARFGRASLAAGIHNSMEEDREMLESMPPQRDNWGRPLLMALQARSALIPHPQGQHRSPQDGAGHQAAPCGTPREKLPTCNTIHVLDFHPSKRSSGHFASVSHHPVKCYHYLTVPERRLECREVN